MAVMLVRNAGDARLALLSLSLPFCHGGSFFLLGLSLTTFLFFPVLQMGWQNHTT